MKKFFVKRLLRKFTTWLNIKLTIYTSTIIKNVFKMPFTKNKLQNFVKQKWLSRWIIQKILKTNGKMKSHRAYSRK